MRSCLRATIALLASVLLVVAASLPADATWSVVGVDPETGEQVWKPADGGEGVSAEEWSDHADGDAPLAEADAAEEAEATDSASEEE